MHLRHIDFLSSCINRYRDIISKKIFDAVCLLLEKQRSRYAGILIDHRLDIIIQAAFNQYLTNLFDP